MMEVNSQQIVASIKREALKALDDLEDLVNLTNKEGVFTRFIDVKEGEEDKRKEGDKYLKGLRVLNGMDHLMGDIFGQGVLSHGKSVIAVVQCFGGEGEEFLRRLGAVYR